MFAECRPTFTYWDSCPEECDDHLAHWRSCFPNHQVFGPEDAVAALSRSVGDFSKLFESIRIPACRSDVARLALLYVHGGLYVDAHCGISQLSGINAVFDRLNEREVVVCTRWAPRFGKIMPFNGVLWARPGSQLLRSILVEVLDRLEARRSDERRLGFHAYHIWDLSGPGVIWRQLFDVSSYDGSLLPSYIKRVYTLFEDVNPVQRYVFTSYRRSGTHWSERQEKELLFRPWGEEAGQPKNCQ